MAKVGGRANAAHGGQDGCPCVLLVGEWQLVREEWERMAREFLGHDPQEHEMAVFDGSDTPEAEVVASLMSRGLFATRKVVLYRDPPLLTGGGKRSTSKSHESREEDSDDEGRSGAEGASALLQWMDSAVHGDALLVLHVEAADRRLRAFKELSKRCRLVDRSAGRERTRPGQVPQSVRRLVEERLAKASKRMGPGALELFYDLVGDKSHSALVNELDKLLAFCSNRDVIGQDDVAAAVSRHKEEEIFRLVDAMRSLELPRAMESLSRLLGQQVHPLALVVTLKNALERLLAVRLFLEARRNRGLEKAIKDFNAYKASVHQELVDFYSSSGPEGLAEVNPFIGAKGRSVHPFALWQDFKAAYGMDLERLKSTIKALTELDLRLKGGKADPEILLQDFVMWFCDPPAKLRDFLPSFVPHGEDAR